MYNGKYHMFYQYNPYDSHWDSMHWRHAVSEDLLHWEYLPAALAPDESYDRDGCFSGSAVTLPDGRQLLMYTGVVRERHSNGGTVDCQNQCIAVGDGVDYEKCENNLRNWQDSDAEALYEMCLDETLRKSGIDFYNSITDSRNTMLEA